MAVQNGVIEIATGDLLRCGLTTFVAGAGESVRTDVPVPSYRRGQKDATSLSRWNGSSWITINLDTLQMYKEEKNLKIDARTVELINEGFSFDGEEFSLSEPAQINWVAMKTLETLLTWPVSLTTKSDGEYSLAQADLDSFVGTAASAKQSHLDSGRALKIQVNAATTEAGVDAVVDNR